MKKTDYNKQFEETIKSSDGAKILLHCCCAPCATFCFDKINKLSQSKGIKTTAKAFFYNPNIMPESEYFKRAGEIEKLCGIVGTEYKICRYNNAEYLSHIQGLENEPERGKRCAECFWLRLFAAAREAKENGYGYFCTSLTVSPHKDADLINSIGFEIAEKEGVKYLPSDFKKVGGYYRSVALSSDYGLYRQNYCGCSFSEAGHK